jgi:hypothetical protein
MAKEKGTKLPKKVAGVKIPKGLRKAGEAAVDLAQQPVVGEFVAAALTAAAASLMADSKAGKAVRHEAADAASDTLKQASAIGSAVKKVLLEAARELLDNFEQATPEKVLAKSLPAKPKRKKKS